MSDTGQLVATLRNAERAGVYRMPDGCETALAQLVREHGFAVTRVDLEGCRDKAEFLGRVAAALRFPAWFGHNWDALSDCVTDLEWLPAEGYVLVLDRADGFRAAAEADFLTALDIFGDAARAWALEDLPFWTLVGLPTASPGFACL